MAVFARDQVGVNAALVGVIFLVNTVVIVACQIPLAGALAGRARMRVLAVVATLWATAWGVAWVTDATLTGVGAAVALMLVAALFGLGESLQVSAQDPLFIELAPSGAHGRSMALSAMTFQAGMALGQPPVAGCSVEPPASCGRLPRYWPWPPAVWHSAPMRPCPPPRG
ncbi:MFS transporter [Streptomyces sp. NPDC021218]|uniref:MFS transporter n=1 Tax=Streptomyces TaxID=1883 RepID=UPI0036288BDB